MEELVKMLVDEGAIVAHPEQWTLSTAKLLATKVPPTLTGVLQARLDGLPASEKHALQLASVIGIHFWDETLAHIEPAATEQLPPLQGRELVLPQGDLGKDTREYAFKHQVLQQVTYDTVLRSPRRAAHARAAEWFAQATGARSRDFLSLAAEHYARAENAEMACEYFARAAEHASANFAHEVTRVYVSRALELANPADPRMRWRLLRMQERTFETEGRLPEQLELLKSLIELAEELDDDSSRSIAANRRAFNALLSGDYATCESESTRAQKIAEAAGNHDLALEAEGVRVAAYALKGDPVAGRALGERALARARSLGFPKVEVVLLHQLSACTQQLSDTQAQLEYTLQGLELARRIGELRNETGLLANLGILHGFLGADAQAQQYLEEALRLSRARGQRQTEGVILAGLAQVLSRLGEDDLAQERARLSLDLFVAMKLDSYQGYALGVLGTVELARGRIAAAKETFERLESLGREIGYTLHVLDAVEGLARVALAQDDEIEAMQCVERLLAEARELAEKEGRGENWFAGPEEHRIRLTLYRVFCRVNDPRAQPALEEAHRRLQIAAAALSNPVLRESFMTQVPEHKEIVRLWELRRQERPMS
jgi:tetratricopeptide (TPR) repeat protein